jgi:hypothetical protein
MRSMIFSINETFQRFLESIAQGGGGWSSTPPKFALDLKSHLRSLQRPPGGAVPPLLETTGLDNVGSLTSHNPIGLQGLRE